MKRVQKAAETWPQLSSCLSSCTYQLMTRRSEIKLDLNIIRARIVCIIVSKTVRRSVQDDPQRDHTAEKPI